MPPKHKGTALSAEERLAELEKKEQEKKEEGERIEREIEEVAEDIDDYKRDLKRRSLTIAQKGEVEKKLRMARDSRKELEVYRTRARSQW